MDDFTAAFVKGVVTFAVFAGTGAGAVALWLRMRAGRPSDVDRMLEGMREDNAQVQADLSTRIAELEERVDFAERRLVQERQVPRLPRSPEVSTPV